MYREVYREERGTGRGAGGHGEHWEGPEQGKQAGASQGRDSWTEGCGHESIRDRGTRLLGEPKLVRAARTPHKSATAQEQPPQVE